MSTALQIDLAEYFYKNQMEKKANLLTKILYNSSVNLSDIMTNS